jgi:hypothetical protein
MLAGNFAGLDFIENYSGRLNPWRIYQVLE